MRIDIDHIAKLARLRIDSAEKEKFTAQMESMLDLVESLPAVEGSAGGLDPSNPMRLRPDVIEASSPREDILRNAPQTQAGCIVVPRVVE